MSLNRPILLLVDGNALFYRAYHAFPKDLTSPDGELTGAVYGFSRILFGAVRSLRPTHLAVSFDLPGPTFRHEMYDGYKATREKMPDELVAQMPRVREIVEKMEAPVYASERYEADDCLGTIAKQAIRENQDLQVIILSGDRDLLQLVEERISMYAPAIAPKKPTLFTPQIVIDQYGFPPSAIIDYKALRGDPSDNIPGVTGIGEVTATQLITTYGTIDQLFKAVETGNTDGIKPSVLQKLKEQEGQARLSYDLATIHTDAPVTFNLDDCRLSLQHPEHLVDLFRKLGFRSLIDELPNSHRLHTTAQDVFGDAPEETRVVQDSPESESDRIDLELAPILRQMEQTGVRVNIPYLKTLEDQLNSEISTIKDKLFDFAGQNFNPDSPQQVGHILYEVLHIPTQGIRKGKTGFTTDASTLQELAPNFPVAAVLLEYRERIKLLTTYVRPLQELADDGSRIHTSYAPDTSTGRISSKNPNLQNIPVKTELGRMVRKAFIAEAGKTLVCADYSQIELRVAAHLSQDPYMIESFRSGKDFHAETAERMGVDRRTAKVINFSILYGKGAFGFSQDLGISVVEAKQYIEQYFKTYSKLRVYLDGILSTARQNGFAETMLGRRRYFTDLTSSNFQRRSAAEREAVNLPIQGSAADILKKAMCNLAKELEGTPYQMILTVHDELVLEVPKNESDRAASLLREVMTSAVKLDVPLEVDIEIGPDWDSVEKIY